MIAKSNGQIAIVASIIFKLADTHPDVGPNEAGEGGKNGVAWVLRFGGLMALVGLVGTVCQTDH